VGGDEQVRGGRSQSLNLADLFEAHVQSAYSDTVGHDVRTRHRARHDGARVLNDISYDDGVAV